MSIRRSTVRAWFPSLQTKFAYLENAGTSQVPAVVAEAMAHFMTTSYVQLGAGYGASRRADAVVAEAHAWMETFVNAADTGRVALGPSTTVMMRHLAGAYGRHLSPGDEIIVADNNHESNAGPWYELAERGIVVRPWRVNPTTGSPELADLADLLNPRTKLVTLPHVSNLIGRVEPVAEVATLAHNVGARVVVDGVAFAPHRAIDVQALGADWYVFSNYKVYGPQNATLFGKNEAFAELTGPNHFFIDPTAIPYKFEPGGVSSVNCAGLLALRPYFQFLSDTRSDDRQTVTAAYATMESLERPLTERLLAYLATKPQVRVHGDAAVTENSVATISFTHTTLSSAEIVAAVHRHPVGIRHGHMYAYRLCQGLGLEPVDGVVRVSMVHYNSEDEVDALINGLEDAQL